MSINLYRLKPAFLRALDPVVETCVRRGIRPDTLTLLAVPVAFLGAVAIAASPAVPALLLLVLVAGSDGVVPEIRRRLVRRPRPGPRAVPPRPQVGRSVDDGSTVLATERLVKRLGATNWSTCAAMRSRKPV